MRGIIFGAGRGSRLGEYTEDLSKSFVEIGDRFILEWQLESLSRVCDEILLVVGYGFKDIDSPEDFVHDTVEVPEGIELSVLYLGNWDEFENAGTCYHALTSEWVSGDRDLLLVCGDVIFSPNVLTRFTQYINKQENLSYVFAIEGLQSKMTAVQWDDDGYIDAYGAIEGHQEAGVFFLDSTQITKATEILEQNINDWFPIIFPEIKTKPFIIDENEQVEINTPEHLQEAKHTIQQIAPQQQQS